MIRLVFNFLLRKLINKILFAVFIVLLIAVFNGGITNKYSGLSNLLSNFVK